MKKIIMTILICIIALGVLIQEGMTQTAGSPQIKISLALDKEIYLMSEPMKITISLENTGADNVITSKGFEDKPLHLYLIFFDAEGKRINANGLQGGDPSPPSAILLDTDGDGNFEMVQAEEVEILPGSWTLSVSIPDAHGYYTLAKSGRYSVKAFLPMRTYPESGLLVLSGMNYARIDSSEWAGVFESNVAEFSLVSDMDGDGYSYPIAVSPQYKDVPDCNDSSFSINPGTIEILNNGIDDDCNPATPDIIPVQPGAISIKAEIQTGSGKNKKTVPAEGLPVRVYDKSKSSCVRAVGMSKQNYKSVWLSCIPVQNGIGITDNSGALNFILEPGDYMVIGEYDPDKISFNGDEIYDGVTAGKLSSGAIIQKSLQFTVKN